MTASLRQGDEERMKKNVENLVDKLKKVAGEEKEEVAGEEDQKPREEAVTEKQQNEENLKKKEEADEEKQEKADEKLKSLENSKHHSRGRLRFSLKDVNQECRSRLWQQPKGRLLMHMSVAYVLM
ncbi:hypothetical protein HanXRQr2_Chr13g0591111 [Helianthus annuus]|uniref:Uncharacterized protein n=1 Tax=Helianthus annuus TaxID=4232 RepID=A0A9K3HC69_HELAN|nr:hypothetical protein HanXRQr2_Chr13g0591111 [Helianthus annuus]